MKTLGLIGYPLTHSFSKKYFSNKFEEEHITGYEYQLFPLSKIEELPELIGSNPNICGLNVTIPYKEKVIPYLDKIDASASFGAVNTINFDKGKLIGYNTDVYGFEETLKPILPDDHSGVLVLGTGGAAKAVCHVLQKLNLSYQKVSRTPVKSGFTYDKLSKEILAANLLIINTTPLGMLPNLDTYPNIPYEYLTPKHILIDLVYNPTISQFLKRGADNGCTLKNGLEMLYLQAEKAWDIWTS